MGFDVLLVCFLGLGVELEHGWKEEEVKGENDSVKNDCGLVIKILSMTIENGNRCWKLEGH